MTHDLRKDNMIKEGDELGVILNVTWHYDVGDGAVHDYDKHYQAAIEKNGNITLLRPFSGPGSLGKHTWHRNHHNIGVCFCAANADHITDDQIESGARFNAELMIKFKLPKSAIVDHVHWANLDGYGPSSGDPDTKIDLCGTERGKEVMFLMLKKIDWYLEKLRSGEIVSVLGK